MSKASWQKTACNICYVNCGVEVLVENDRITKVRGDRDNPNPRAISATRPRGFPSTRIIATA